MDTLTIVMRFALYLDLALLFGLPFFLLYAFRREELSSGIAKRHVMVSAVLAVVGLMLSILSFIMMAKQMSGAESYAEIEDHVFGMMLTGTDFGLAWTARAVALLVCICVTLFTKPSRLSLAVVVLGAGVALSSLAWAGHAVMDDGMWRVLHVGADIAHMLAAGAWVGAIAALLMLANASLSSDAHTVDLLSRTANGFANVGAIIVGTLVVTGAINYGLIVGLVLPALYYGGLLLAKLALFGIMLALGAANRFWHSPALEQAIQGGNHAHAVGTLRKSLRFEGAAAVLILTAVAWLGMQSPLPI